MKKTILLIALLLILILLAVFIDQRSSEQNATDASKNLMDYTWAEFEAMSAAEQMEFQYKFGSIEEFDKWLHKAQLEAEKNPWDAPGAKQPVQYTWEEFEALSAGQQMAFQNSFGSFEKFDQWLQKAQLEAERNPWDAPGAKQPAQYTWEEFEALSAGQQMAFQNSFDSLEGFMKWLAENEPYEN